VHTLSLVYGRQVSLKHRLVTVFILLLLFTSAVYLFRYNPDGSTLYPTCPFHLLTGFYCPGCGSLRALHQIMHGNIQSALDFNPLTVVFTPLLGWMIVSQFSVVIRGRPLPWLLTPALWMWILSVIIIIFWILRNIPVFPFNVLAP